MVYAASLVVIVHDVAEFFQEMMTKGFLIGYKTASDLVSRLCSFAVVLLAVRYLTTTQFGLFSLAWAAGWMVSIGSDFGLQIHLTKEVARHPDSAEEIFTRLSRLRLTLCGFVFMAVAGLAPLLVDPVHIAAFLLVVLSQIFNSLIEFNNHLYRGLSRSDLESTLNLLFRAVTLGLAGVFLYSFRSFPALAFGLASSNWFGLLAAQLLSRRALRSPSPVSGSAGPHGEPTASGPDLLKQILPLGVGIVLSALYFRIDLFFIEWLHGPDSVALYNAVFRLIDALRLLPAAVMAVIFPDLCRPGATKVVGWSLAGLTAGSVILASGCFWQAAWIVQICYGSSYAPAVATFRLLLLSVPLLFVNLLLTHLLIALNLQRGWAILCGMGLVGSLVLNGLLVPYQANNGAALACLLRELLLTGGCALILYRAGRGLSGPPSQSEGLAP